MTVSVSLFSNFWRTSVFFVGPLVTPIWTSGDVCHGFQSQGGFPHFHVSSPACNGFLLWPVLQPSLFDPLTCTDTNIGVI